MGAFEVLAQPEMAWMYARALIAGACIVAACALLSVLVVLKRLAFVGQGISHAAFGGVGLAMLIGALAPALRISGVEFAVLLLFCVATALGIARATRSGDGGEGNSMHEDTAIGVFLVGSMAAGALLVQLSRSIAESRGVALAGRSWESILFGSILATGWLEVALGGAVLAVIVGVLTLVRRPLLFWAMDEGSAQAFGVPTPHVRAVLMVLLALVVVTATKLAGVVLATALLVLPGAAALRLTRRLAPVLVTSILIGLIGLVGGLALSLVTNWQPGPSVVLVLTALLGGASLWGR
ncbi:MAG: metal ABC transporter permease [Phycisphaerales bacterium]|nr:metal ABC transporter permease [Phycisphaerales bacterium]